MGANPAAAAPSKYTPGPVVSYQAHPAMSDAAPAMSKSQHMDAGTDAVWPVACRYQTEEEKQQLLPVLRELSRQEYLKKREDAKLVGLAGAGTLGFETACCGPPAAAQASDAQRLPLCWA